MKDQIALLLTALVCSALAWAFWHWMGADGFNVLAIFAMTVLFVDNRRLRAQLLARVPSTHLAQDGA